MIKLSKYLESKAITFKKGFGWVVSLEFQKEEFDVLLDSCAEADKLVEDICDDRIYGKLMDKKDIRISNLEYQLSNRNERIRFKDQQIASLQESVERLSAQLFGRTEDT